MLPQEENVCFQETFNVAEMPGEGIMSCELQLAQKGQEAVLLMVCVNNHQNELKEKLKLPFAIPNCDPLLEKVLSEAQITEDHLGATA